MKGDVGRAVVIVAAAASRDASPTSELAGGRSQLPIPAGDMGDLDGRRATLGPPDTDEDDDNLRESVRWSLNGDVGREMGGAGGDVGLAMCCTGDVHRAGGGDICCSSPPPPSTGRSCSCDTTGGEEGGAFRSSNSGLLLLPRRKPFDGDLAREMMLPVLVFPPLLLPNNERNRWRGVGPGLKGRSCGGGDVGRAMVMVVVVVAAVANLRECLEIDAADPSLCGDDSALLKTFGGRECARIGS